MAECLSSLCIVSNSISTSTFKLVLPTWTTLAINSAKVPAGIASLKSTLSEDMVTKGLRQKRVAAINATSSIHASASPPNKVL